MNPKLSDRVNNMATSATLAMAAKTRELREAKEETLSDSAWENLTSLFRNS